MQITVAQFKTKIADTVNIPAETQRIIYCGRVLEDDVKLSDYGECFLNLYCFNIRMLFYSTYLN